MISAAMSMSRIAIHCRPTRPRTRFFATSAITTTSASAKTYLFAGDADGLDTIGFRNERNSSVPPGAAMRPKMLRGGDSNVPDEWKFENQGTLLNSHCRKNCAASVATAR